MSVQIDVLYEGDLHCVATHNPSKSTLTTDAPVDNGGKGETFSPTDLVATALGSCIITIIGLYAKKKEFDITGTTVRVIKEMVSKPVRRIGSLDVVITLPKGNKYSDADRAVFENIAKMCPVKQSFCQEVNVTIKFVYPD
ncbi:MAG: OsmC family protein [Planctomycetota bacterium]